MVSKIRLGKLDVLIKTTFSSANVVPTPAGLPPGLVKNNAV